MILQYGRNKRPSGECAFSIDRQSLRTDADTIWAYEETWTIQGWLRSQKATAAAARGEIKRLTEEVEDFFSVEGLDLKMLQPGGGETAHNLLAASTIGGTKIVKPPHFLDGNGAQGVTFRTYTVVLAATVPVDASNVTTLVKSFQETVDVSGGGARFAHLETLVGLPVKQQVRRNTVFRGSQKGQAVGIYAYPSVPAPLWPEALVNANPVVTRGSPKRIGTGYVEYPISWQWEFESAYPLVGRPNRWAS